MENLKKYLLLIITNLVIVILGLVVNWDSWGAIIPCIFICLIILVINPILIVTVFNKDNNKLLRVLVGILVSIFLFVISCSNIRSNLALPW